MNREIPEIKLYITNAYENDFYKALIINTDNFKKWTEDDFLESYEKALLNNAIIQEKTDFEARLDILKLYTVYINLELLCISLDNSVDKNLRLYDFCNNFRLDFLTYLDEIDVASWPIQIPNYFLNCLDEANIQLNQEFIASCSQEIEKYLNI